MISILQESRIILTPDQEHKTDIHNIPAAGFHNCKSLKDKLVRAKLQNAEETGRSEPCGKRNFQVYIFIWDRDTFSTKACDETFKILSGPVNCSSQKVVFLLKNKICG